MRPGQSQSLRSRFLLIVLIGAVLPLAIAGWWLAHSAVRSAEVLLRAQLDTSLAAIASRVEGRWAYRRSDLLFLANNEVTVRTLSPGSRAAAAADSDFMARLHASVQPTIQRALFRSQDGTVRWTFDDVPPDNAAGSRAMPGPAFLHEAGLPVTLPIRAGNSTDVGTVEAEVRMGAILPADSIPILVNGAQLSVVDHRSGHPLTSAGAIAIPRDLDRFTVDGAPWIAVRRAFADPPIDITIAAPSGPYLAPFERAARLGLLVFVVVTLLVLALTTYFTARVTRSLERLVGAADAVAAGDLQRDVETNGHDEVGRLARSFNTMLHSLRRTLRELAHREALAAVGEFAASLSHEVRNGLSAVRVDLQRIEESAAPDSAAGALVARALRNLHRLDGTVTGALVVARGAHANLQPVDLRAVLEASAAAAESAFATSGSALSIDSGPVSSCAVRADGAALEQLFLNLFLNAGQAMSSGGRATVELSVDESTCTVAIRDSGTGMALEQVARSGQPFYSSKRGGTGLGLNIAKKIAAAHGGELSIESRPGDGTVVRVRLPRERTVEA